VSRLTPPYMFSRIAKLQPKLLPGPADKFDPKYLLPIMSVKLYTQSISTSLKKVNNILISE
jgi:hypothetical protein